MADHVYLVASTHQFPLDELPALPQGDGDPGYTPREYFVDWVTARLAAQMQAHYIRLGRAWCGL